MKLRKVIAILEHILQKEGDIDVINDIGSDISFSIGINTTIPNACCEGKVPVMSITSVLTIS